MITKEEIKVVDFLKAKFGDMTYKYHCYTDDNTQIGGDLEDILEEFRMIVEADKLTEFLNPRNKKYTLIDKPRGIVIGHYKRSLLSV